MDSDIFKAGVEPGGLTSHDEVKMLVCNLLHRVEAPMSFSQIHESLQENGLVNYFELVAAVDGLARSGHLSPAPAGEAGEDRYALTEIGVQAGEEFENILPRAVREKAVRTAKDLLQRQRRAAELVVRTEKAQSGYIMHLAIPDAGGDLVSFSVFVPTLSECDLIRRRFLNDPLYIYQGVLALLTGNRKVLGEIFPGK